MSEPVINNLGNGIKGSGYLEYSAHLAASPSKAQSKHTGAHQDTSEIAGDGIELSDDVEEESDAAPDSSNPLVDALKSQNGEDGAEPESPEGDETGLSDMGSSTGQTVSDPFSDGTVTSSLARSTGVPDSFVSNTGVDTPGDSSGNTVPSLTVDLGDSEVAKAQISNEITNQQLAQDQSRQAEDQSGNAGSKLQNEISRHRGEQSTINSLTKSKQDDQNQGTEQVEAEKQQIEDHSNSINQVQEAGNARAAQVAEMQTGLNSDQQAVDDAGASIDSAQQAEDDAQSAMDTAQQKLSDIPSATEQQQPAEATPSKTGETEGNGKGKGSEKSSEKSQASKEKQAEEQQKLAEEQRQRAEQQAQQQVQQAQQKLNQAQQQVQQAQQRQSKAQQQLQQDQTKVESARQGLGDYSKVLDNGIKARRGVQTQMAQDQKTLQDDIDGVRHLANRNKEISGFVDQNQAALVTTGKVEQISQDNVKGADQNIRQLKNLLPEFNTKKPGSADDGGEDQDKQQRTRERLKATPTGDPASPGQSPNTGSSFNSAGVEAAQAAGVNAASNTGSTKTTQRGDRMTIDLVTLKNAEAEVAGDANAGGGRNQGYVGGIDDAGGASIAAAEGGNGNSNDSSSNNPTINDSGGEGGGAHGKGEGDQGEHGKSASAPGHNKGGGNSQ
jgi:hypothetical protein